MTTLYRPVLIESTEQAEALPIGTVALDHPRGTRDELIPYVKATPDRWASVWDVSALGNIKSYGTAPNEAMVGDRALVPIEAEEETLERRRVSQPVPDVLHRFTTPWTLYTPKETP